MLINHIIYIVNMYVGKLKSVKFGKIININTKMLSVNLNINIVLTYELITNYIESIEYSALILDCAVSKFTKYLFKNCNFFNLYVIYISYNIVVFSTLLHVQFCVCKIQIVN